MDNMFNKKELNRIFGNITYVLSRGLKSEPKILTVSEEMQCQLFYFPKKANNLLFCLYLDGQDLKSIILSILCVDKEVIDGYVPKNILGEDFEYRIPNFYVHKQSIPISASDVYAWSAEDIVNVILNNKRFNKHIKWILKNKGKYRKIWDKIDFVSGSIDVELRNK